MGKWFGHDSIDGDFPARLAHEIAVRQYATLDQGTRDVYEGFAAGANRYVKLHPEEFLPGSTRSSPATTSPRRTGQRRTGLRAGTISYMEWILVYTSIFRRLL